MAELFQILFYRITINVNQNQRTFISAKKEKTIFSWASLSFCNPSS